MKILLIGGTGLLGSAVAEELNEHEVITAARHDADVEVDITKPETIKNMFEKTGKVDAVVSTTGNAQFVPFEELTPEMNETAIDSKMKGQINLVLIGKDYVNDGGSFTLTTGVIMDEPIAQGTSSAMANGALKAFTKSAAREMPRGIRINSVSPTVIEEAPESTLALFPGFESVPVSKVARAFKRSVEGIQTGESYEVYS